ncbi:MAG TPA: UDP-2,4-diacetamido-2,4,6-trideoxy-beta-L-altropyranose hydrolase [Cyclobacteriaceae bacterium]|nr:UDP-2,4-diacetamido-2,4,6-trideoxy-beta-L-altropyranose hydrolase [Cyclobacteriaceae bacterium]
MKKQKIIFRADANSIIGHGHVNRCIALAEILCDDFDVTIAIQEPDLLLHESLSSTFKEIIVLPIGKTNQEFDEELYPFLNGTEIVVIDGYSFNDKYEKSVRLKSSIVLTIDDVPSRHYASDYIINYCEGLNQFDYSKEFYTQLFIGIKYLFLRNPFLRKDSRRDTRGLSLLINMGGSDPQNETRRILMEIIDSNYNGDINVVIGSSYKHLDSLLIIVNSAKNVHLKRNLSAMEMFDLMSNSPIAILPPSIVSLEYLSTGGKLLVVRTAENQSCLYNFIINKRLGFDYSKIAVKKADELPPPVEDVQLFFDGKSLERLRRLFTVIGENANLKLRLANADDSILCYDWVNDPSVREYSYSKSTIRLDDHMKWFSKKICDSNSKYYIAIMDTNPVGQIRFDKDLYDNYIISYMIAKDWRGRGLGVLILIKGILLLQDEAKGKKIIGFVQHSNFPSIRAFETLGFKKFLDEKHQNSYRFELNFDMNEDY